MNLGLSVVLLVATVALSLLLRRDNKRLGNNEVTREVDPATLEKMGSTTVLENVEPEKSGITRRVQVSTVEPTRYQL